MRKLKNYFGSIFVMGFVFLVGGLSVNAAIDYSDGLVCEDVIENEDGTFSKECTVGFEVTEEPADYNQVKINYTVDAGIENTFIKEEGEWYLKTFLTADTMETVKSFTYTTFDSKLSVGYHKLGTIVMTLKDENQATNVNFDLEFTKESRACTEFQDIYFGKDGGRVDYIAYQKECNKKISGKPKGITYYEGIRCENRKSERGITCILEFDVTEPVDYNQIAIKFTVDENSVLGEVNRTEIWYITDYDDPLDSVMNTRDHNFNFMYLGSSLAVGHHEIALLTFLQEDGSINYIKDFDIKFSKVERACIPLKDFGFKFQDFHFWNQDIYFGKNGGRVDYATYQKECDGKVSDKQKENEEFENPQTGSSLPIISLLLLACLSLGIIFYTKRKNIFMK